jgi:hypothetical protein
MKFVIAFMFIFLTNCFTPSASFAVVNSNTTAYSPVLLNKKLTYKERVLLKHAHLKAKFANSDQFIRKLLISGGVLLILGLIVVIRFNRLVSPNNSMNLSISEAVREGLAYLFAIAALIVSGLLFLTALILSIRV